RRQLQQHHGEDRLQLADDRALEAPVRGRPPRGPRRAPPWLEADRADARAASAHSRLDTPRPAARGDALVDSIAGPQTRRAAHHRRPRVARRWPAAASGGALYALGRSRVRDEGGGRDRALPRSPATRRCLLHRREDGDSGARPDRPVAAAVAWTCRTTWVRVLPARHAVAVCGAQHADR